MVEEHLCSFSSALLGRDCILSVMRIVSCPRCHAHLAPGPKGQVRDLMFFNFPFSRPASRWSVVDSWGYILGVITKWRFLTQLLQHIPVMLQRNRRVIHV